jgi:hypothetical protein
MVQSLRILLTLVLGTFVMNAALSERLTAQSSQVIGNTISSGYVAPTSKAGVPGQTFLILRTPTTPTESASASASREVLVSAAPYGSLV